MEEKTFIYWNKTFTVLLIFKQKKRQLLKESVSMIFLVKCLIYVKYFLELEYLSNKYSSSSVSLKAFTNEYLYIF